MIELDINDMRGEISDTCRYCGKLFGQKDYSVGKCMLCNNSIIQNNDTRTKTTRGENSKEV